MIAATVTLKKGDLAAFAKSLDDADGAYLKVGVLGSSAARKNGGSGNNRWTGTWKRWNKKAGKYTINKPTWSAKNGAYLTNADIGAIHEFGSPTRNIPERSFLRVPILSRLDDEISGISLADWQRTFFAGSASGPRGGLVAVLQVIGQAAVQVIQDAFHTGGFGRWAPLKRATIERKGSSDILVDTTQLRRSITFAVIKKGSP